MIYGDAQVSTDGQSVDAQVTQLKAAGTGSLARKECSYPRPLRLGQFIPFGRHRSAPNHQIRYKMNQRSNQM